MPREPWIDRDDGVGAICRHFHAQDHSRWKAIGMGGAIACVVTLLLPWYTFAFFGAGALDFLNILGDGVRSPDWPIIAIASAVIIATLYLGHPMWALCGCAFLCYFAVSNLMSALSTLGFMHPTLWLLVYIVAAVVTTYAALGAGALDELNQALPATNSPYRQQ